MSTLKYPDFIISLVLLMLVTIAFVRLCVIRPRPRLGAKGGIEILLLAGAYAVGMWLNHMIINDVILTIYIATVVILLITGIFVWIGSKQNVQDMTHSETSFFPVEDSIAPLFSKQNTFRWQLTMLIYLIIAVFMWILFSKDHFNLPGTWFYIMLGIWVVFLALGCGIAIHALSRVNTPEESMVKPLLKLVGGFLLGLLGLGSSQSWWLMMMDKETVLKNREIVQQKNLQTQLFLGVGVWLVWGVCSGGLVGFEKAHYFVGLGLFLCIFFPLILIAMARFKGFFP